MLRGDQQNEVDLSFSIPSACAAEIAEDVTEIGLVPVWEIARQGLEISADLGGMRMEMSMELTEVSAKAK